MVLQSLFPVFALLVLGAVLKRLDLTNDVFLKTSDKLIYFIFFPIMLFWKIGGASGSEAIESGLCLAVFLAVTAVHILSTAYIYLFRVRNFQAGSFSQSCYRFNTYIGMAIVSMALGEAGARRFGILIGFTIPFINLLAVLTLIWFSGERLTPGARFRIALKALLSNPLILGCFAGIAFSLTRLSFPAYLNNTFQLISSVTLPLALLSIGASLSLKSLKGNIRLSLVSAAFKLAALPAIGLLLLKWYEVPDLALKVGMIFFTMPTSTAIYVLSSQLNSDTELASASIFVSTVLSFAALSTVLSISF